MVKLEGFELFIQKLSDNHTQSVQRKRRDLTNPHIVYRRAAESDEATVDPSNDDPADHFCALDFGKLVVGGDRGQAKASLIRGYK